MIAVVCPIAVHGEHPITVSSMTFADPTHSTIILDVTVPAGDAFYADYFSFSTDHPAITITDWQASSEPTQKYDVTFKATKKIFTQPFTITLHATIADTTITNANLHVGYYEQSKKHNKYAIFPLVFFKKTAYSLTEPKQEESTSKNETLSVKKEMGTPRSSLSITLSTLLQTTESWWVQLLLSFLLGMLLSLTPCIYPMIPITMGILQSHASNSISRNFSLALAYTIGIASTFALLGTIAAFSGTLFGNVMNNPFVILSIVALLAYLAGSMIGLYELYIPRFLQPNQTVARGGSLRSAFLFGAISGTVASPCLSPGLLLLLTMVTSIGSIVIGFSLLFAFGFGLGVPLLMLGTFSGSLTMLPRAGMWMIDIQQFFGFILLATCFYFLSMIIAFYILMWIIALFIVGIALFYLYHAQYATPTARRVKNIIGILLLATSVHLFFYAYKTTHIERHCMLLHDIWIKSFEQGVRKAKECGKLLLIDIRAPYCSLCTAIEKKFFTKPYMDRISKVVVLVKIDDIEKDATTKTLQKKFNIIGAPTIIIWDPLHEQEIQRWGGELYDYSIEEFIAQLSLLKENHEKK